MRIWSLHSIFFLTDPPEIDVEGSWLHSGEGQEAILACVVHADPPTTVSVYDHVHILRLWTSKPLVLPNKQTLMSSF